jgi:predicted regulator of Ras-like GTPase activity (Roadblock/LC7/MglB family)
MADEIHRLSDELARDPASLAFLQLGELLRRQSQLDTALKVALRGLERHPHNADAHDLLARIAVDRGELERAFDEWDMVLRLVPGHSGALKGMGYVCFHQGRFEEAERYLRDAATGRGDAQAEAALENLRASVAIPVVRDDPAPAADDPRRMFAEVIGEADQTALLLDANGLVLGGAYVNEHGDDVAQIVGAELSGVSDEAERAARHLSLGAWRAIVVETPVATVAMSPTHDDGLVMLAASRETPLGLVRRVLDRCRAAAQSWLEARA